MDICRHDEHCGGCIYQGVKYEEQLKLKEEQVKKLLDEKNIEVEHMDEIEGSPSQYMYRNKMEYTFGDQVKDGPMTLGMHQKGRFMSIVTVDDCGLVHEDFNIILKSVLNFCTSNGYSKYHKKTHRGMMRNLIVRWGVNTGQLLINVVTSSEPGFDEASFVTMLKELKLENNLVGILRTFNDNIADAVNCEELKILFGRDYYMEKINNLEFKVSAFSFFQTNILAVENLYNQALELIGDYNDKTVLDLFCGTGTISQIMAKKAKSVVGVEIVEDAVKAARYNAKINKLDNCKFIAGDVFKVLEGDLEKPDVVVVDPPRMGIQPKALDKIVELGVKEILYISCNPKTLVDNLSYLDYFNYKVKYLKPFDNFPNTKHIEVVTKLTK